MKKYADKILIAFAIIIVICVAVETPFLVEASNAQFKKFEQLNMHKNNKPRKEGIHIEVQEIDSVDNNLN